MYLVTITTTPKSKRHAKRYEMVVDEPDELSAKASAAQRIPVAMTPLNFSVVPLDLSVPFLYYIGEE